MSGFRADARAGKHLLRAASLLIGLVSGGAALPADALAATLAQAGPPVRLTPTPPPAADPPATPKAPRPETSTPAVPYIPGEGTAIEVTQPTPISTDSVGLKDPVPAGGPDPPSKGSARTLIEQLIRDLPHPITSPPAPDLLHPP